MANTKKNDPSNSDFVNDPIFGVVPKDVETMIRLREEASAKGEADPTINVPVEIVEKVGE